MLASLAVSRDGLLLAHARTIDPLAVLCISQYIFPNRNWCIKRYTNNTFSPIEVLQTYTLTQRCLATYFLQQMDRDHSRSNVWPYRQYDGGDRYEEYVVDKDTWKLDYYSSLVKSSFKSCVRKIVSSDE